MDRTHRKTGMTANGRPLLEDEDGRRFLRCECGEEADLNRYCAAYVCPCGNHVGLARCWCGWSRSGGDGRRELVEMGETLDDY